MALTRSYRETINERMIADPDFANALLDEAITLFLNGDSESARLALREVVNSTVGFEALALETTKPVKSLHRMLSSKGNPSMDNLANIFSVIRKSLNVELRTQVIQITC